MPQLEFSTYFTQIFWVTIVFISFWLIMDRVIVPKIAEMIEARQRKYDDFIIKAELVNKKALDALNRYETTLAAAKEKAAEQIKQNENELKEFLSRKEDTINFQLKEKVAQSEEKLFREKQETMLKIEELAELAALTIINRLDLQSSITLPDIQAASKKEEV